MKIREHHLSNDDIIGWLSKLFDGLDSHNAVLSEDAVMEGRAYVSHARERIRELEQERDKLRAELERSNDCIDSLLHQFAYPIENPAALIHGGLSALEDGFEILGWDSPHPTPHNACDEPGCGKHATCGWPTVSGYRRTCGEHMTKGGLAEKDGSKP